MSDTDEAPAALLARDISIINRKGLHARASAKFVQCVEGFDADVTVTKDGHTVSGTSIMGLMMLAAGIGSSIHVTADGPQASEAMDAITALVGNRFGEEE
ncbi:HPr family phosphocarrier protein [Chthonobacter albigriseus]|uniref:HPr family phosphocarrier protein n=1 Tax=Chthonobacter albigriseus TaxID=1683161 RepID=UPI0015EE76B1|nr:HPr family phosphocarrier protein [Chthonobacter albigriseus]